jgi:hypothetical protein
VAGSGPGVVRLMRVTLCGLRSPSSLVDLGYVQAVLPELEPVARAAGRSDFSWVCGFPAGCRDGLSSPSFRDASSKATPVYHPRG